jgi:hypothetical protein
MYPVCTVAFQADPVFYIKEVFISLVNGGQEDIH